MLFPSLVWVVRLATLGCVRTYGTIPLGLATTKDAERGRDRNLRRPCRPGAAGRGKLTVEETSTQIPADTKAPDTRPCIEKPTSEPEVERSCDETARCFPDGVRWLLSSPASQYLHGCQSSNGIHETSNIIPCRNIFRHSRSKKVHGRHWPISPRCASQEGGGTFSSKVLPWDVYKLSAIAFDVAVLEDYVEWAKE